jgi:hypothetical protein
MLDKEKEQAQWDNWLGEAVRKIRLQKQRPGLDRIYNAVRLIAEKEHQAEQSQRSPIAPIYNMQFNTIQVVQVQRHLDRAVKSGLLLKVISKGQTTYKTPDKCERQLNLAQPTPDEMSKCVIKVIKELSETDPTASTSTSSPKKSPNGFSIQTITDYIRHSHVISFPPEESQKEEFLLSKVQDALAREVKRNKVDLVEDLYKIHVPGPKPGNGGGSGSGGVIFGGSGSGGPFLINPEVFTPTALARTMKERSSGSISSSSSISSGASGSGGSPKAILEVETDEFRALVKEQTARAVKLVMKDRLSESPPGSLSATSSRKSSKDSRRSSKSTTPERPEASFQQSQPASISSTCTSSMLKELTQLTRVMTDQQPNTSPGRSSPGGALSVTTTIITAGGGPDGSEEVKQIMGSSVSASALDLLEKVKDVAAACTASNSSVTLTLTCTMSREDGPSSPAASSTTSTASSGSSSSISSTKFSSGNKETAVIKLMVPSFRVGAKPPVIANPGGNSTMRKIIGGGGGGCAIVSSGGNGNGGGSDLPKTSNSTSGGSSGIKKSGGGNKSPKAHSPKSHGSGGGHSPKQGGNNNSGNNSPKSPSNSTPTVPAGDKPNPGSKSPTATNSLNNTSTNTNVINASKESNIKAGALSLAIPAMFADQNQKGPLSISDIASAIVYEVRVTPI